MCLRITPGFGCSPALPLPYLERGPVGELGFLAALGGHGGIAGADEHRGADLQRRAVGGCVDHAVQGVEGRGDGELPQTFPPGVRHLGESCRIRGLGLGRRRSQGCALKLGGPVAFGDLQELLSGGAWLEETTGDVMGFQKLHLAQPQLLGFPFPIWQKSCRQGSGGITGYL